MMAAVVVVVVVSLAIVLVVWLVKRRIRKRRASLLLIQQSKHDPKDDGVAPVVGGAVGGALGTLHKPRRSLVNLDYERLQNVNMDREYHRIEVRRSDGVNEVRRGDGVNEVRRSDGINEVRRGDGVNEVRRGDVSRPWPGEVNEVSEADSGCYDLGTEQNVDTAGFGRVRGQSAYLEGQSSLSSSWKQSIFNSHLTPGMARPMTMGGVFKTGHAHHSRNRSHGSSSQRGSLTSSHGTSSRTSRSTFSSSSMGYGSGVFDLQSARQSKTPSQDT